VPDLPVEPTNPGRYPADMESRVAMLEQIARSTTTGMDRLDNRMDGLDHRMDRLDHRMDGLDQRMGSFDRRMDGFDHRMDVVGSLADRAQRP